MLLDFMEERRVLLSTGLDQCLMLWRLDDAGVPHIMRVMILAEPPVKATLLLTDDR
jgi:hypothetical protein